MLNLQELKKNSTYEFIYFDGTKVHLNKPSQKLLRKVTQLSNIKDDDSTDIIDTVYSLLVEVLNNNSDDRKFMLKEVKEQFDFELIPIFFTDYLDSVMKALGE